MAVGRVESQGMQSFTAQVADVKLEEDTEGKRQYHLYLKPKGMVIKGPTGFLHEWIPMSQTTTDDGVAKGSAMDMFLRQLEIAEPAAKKANTISQAMQAMVGNSYLFEKMELGRAYQGNAAKQYSVPVRKA
jgi:hypothetical protein